MRTCRSLLLIVLVCPAVVLMGGCSPSARISEPDRVTIAVPPSTPRVLGYSVQGRSIELLSFGTGPRRVLLIGLIHGNEPEGFEEFHELLETLHRAEIGATTTLHAIPNMNPDGYLANTRGNARGVDLNRNWPTGHFQPSRRNGQSPLSEPETQAVHAHLRSFAPDLLIVLHSVGDGPFVDADGPGDAEAKAFVDAASRIDPRWVVRSDYTNPPGSLGTYAGIENGIATLTVEFKRGQDATLARRSAEAGLLSVLMYP